jgi:hypothetical protein
MRGHEGHTGEIDSSAISIGAGLTTFPYEQITAGGDILASIRFVYLDPASSARGTFVSEREAIYPFPQY